MAEKKKPVETVEDKYLKAKHLEDSIKCLLRDKERAETYRDVASIYDSLDFEDSKERAEACREKAEEYKKKVKQQEKEEKAAKKADEKEENKKHTILFRKIVLCLIVFLIVVMAAGVIYLKTYSGRYTRAAFYEKYGNYKKSYLMFRNLKDYKDSSDRSKEAYYKYAKALDDEKNYKESKKVYKELGDYKDSEDKFLESTYKYGEQCIVDNNMEESMNAYRELGDYKESARFLTELEMGVIYQSNVGDEITYGNTQWLVLKKENRKFLLVKSKPENEEKLAFDDSGKKQGITWKNSSIRKYMNKEFIKEMFSSEEAERIIETKVGNSKTVTTRDKIFFLNAKQATKYQEILMNYLRDWWLIDTGANENTAQFVSYGELMDYGYEVSSTNLHMRPAMWVSLD